jgi:hypothetical protein
MQFQLRHEAPTDSQIEISFAQQRHPCRARTVAKFESKFTWDHTEDGVECYTVHKHFYGNGKAKFPKLAQREVPEAQDYPGCRLRTSPLRSHHNSRNNGISESMKKTGPPRRWIRL